MDERPKGILKSAEDIHNQAKVPAAPVSWDEENITLTLHPPDKDYGHMKIDEPKTPYEYYNGSDDEMGGDVGSEPWTPRKQLDSQQLQSTLENIDWSSRQLKFEEQAEKMSLDESKAKKNFAAKRSAHYNEFLAMKEAKAAGLLDDDDEDNEDNETKTVTLVEPAQSSMEQQHNGRSVSPDDMEAEQHTPPSSSGMLEVKEPKQNRRVSISSDTPDSKSKDPAKMSDFEKKRKAHYTGEFKKALGGDKYYLRKKYRKNRRSKRR